jgi:hypothetical protein
VSEPERVGEILGGCSTDRATLERVLDGLRAENGSGVETAATGG